MNDNTDNTTSGNVVTFTGNKPKEEPEELVFVCGRCRCQSWRLLSTGVVECANCLGAANPDSGDPAPVEWRKILETVPDDTTELEDEGNTTIVKALGDGGLAMRQTLKKLDTWVKDKELTVVIAYNKNGASTSWTATESKEANDWLIEHLEDYVEVCKATYSGERQDRDGK